MKRSTRFIKHPFFNIHILNKPNPTRALGNARIKILTSESHQVLNHTPTTLHYLRAYLELLGNELLRVQMMYISLCLIRTLCKCKCRYIVSPSNGVFVSESSIVPTEYGSMQLANASGLDKRGANARRFAE
jgi:hypothetical protein